MESLEGGKFEGGFGSFCILPLIPRGCFCAWSAVVANARMGGRSGPLDGFVLGLGNRKNWYALSG